jgi:adenylate kinase
LSAKYYHYSHFFEQEKIPQMKHICVGEVVKTHKCYEGMDFTFGSHILDEEKLLNIMEIMVETAANESLGLIVDFHSCDFFPERWFDLVLVLRADTEVLFDRLVLRGYSDKKRAENLECEIMQVVLDEARESYAPEIVHEIPSNTTQEMVSNINRIEQWCQQWLMDNNM